jgi:hypothetical protein
MCLMRRSFTVLLFDYYKKETCVGKLFHLVLSDSCLLSIRRCMSLPLVDKALVGVSLICFNSTCFTYRPPIYLHFCSMQFCFSYPLCLSSDSVKDSSRASVEYFAGERHLHAVIPIILDPIVLVFCVYPHLLSVDFSRFRACRGMTATLQGLTASGVDDAVQQRR